MLALQLLNSRDVIIEDVTITDSYVSNAHLIYITQVLRLQMLNTYLSRIRRASSFIGDVRVIEIGTLEQFSNKRTVNQITFRNLTYLDSEMSFF